MFNCTKSSEGTKGLLTHLHCRGKGDIHRLSCLSFFKNRKLG